MRKVEGESSDCEKMQQLLLYLSLETCMLNVHVMIEILHTSRVFHGGSCNYNLIPDTKILETQPVNL